MTERLHDDEVAIDLALVERLLRSQEPTLARLPLRPVAGQGSDNVVFRLGDDLAVRLPRTSAAVEGLLREQAWLTRVAPHLPLTVPEPVAIGEPSKDYPLPWAVCRWVPGNTPPTVDLDRSDARVIAEFVRALQQVDTSGGPEVEDGRRAGPVAAYDHVARRALDDVAALLRSGRVEPDLVDLRRAEEVWGAALLAPAWTGPKVWVHRDLYHGNIVATDRLIGVIDFGGLAVGDPAGDVMAAFHLLSAVDHDLFREVVGVDDATWARARGWVLVQGLEALPYYLDTHPGMVTMARRAIAASLQG